MVNPSKFTASPSTVNLVLSENKHGYSDYDIVGHATAKRACIPPSLKVGDRFNLYHHGCIKTGVRWAGSIENSLRSVLGVRNINVVNGAS
jgi:hypothetical protein